MRPVEQTRTSSGLAAEPGGDQLAHPLGVGVAGRAGGGVGAAAVHDDGRGLSPGGGQVGPADLHRPRRWPCWW